MPVKQITQEHLAELSTYIATGDRGGFYLKLYQLTGEIINGVSNKWGQSKIK